MPATTLTRPDTSVNVRTLPIGTRLDIEMGDRRASFVIELEVNGYIYLRWLRLNGHRVAKATVRLLGAQDGNEFADGLSVDPMNVNFIREGLRYIVSHNGKAFRSPGVVTKVTTIPPLALAAA